MPAHEDRGRAMNEVKKIGFLADTHSNKPDGSDLPEQVLRAFKGVDLIVHLGDIGRKGILDRLGAVAPVMVPSDDRRGYVRWQTSDAPVKAIEAGGRTVGICFNLAQPDKKIAVGSAITFPDGPLAPLLKRRFGHEAVDVIVSAATHRHHQQVHDGMLCVDPGSPTLPMPDSQPSVAVLDLSGRPAKAKIHTW